MNQDTREIEYIKFGVYSSDEIKRMAVCEINNSKLSIDKLDKSKSSGVVVRLKSTESKDSLSGSVYDPKMGTIEVGINCETCNQNVWKCPGHFGYIEFNEPIIHPLYYKQVTSFLRCFCIKCYKLLINVEQIRLNRIHIYSGNKRFEKIIEKLEKVDICCHCDHPQPEIKFSSSDSSISMVYKHKQNEKIVIVLNVDDIKKIFENISDGDVVLLGFDPTLMHPKNFILTMFPVLPPCARPYVLTDGNMCDDDLTNQYVEIVKANNSLKIEEGVPVSETKRQKSLQSLKFRVSTLFNNSTGKAKHTTNGRPIKALKERITGKDGQIRNNLMGNKTCWVCL